MLNENANKYMHKFSGKDGLIKFERFFRNKCPQNLLPVCKQFGSMREDDTLPQLRQISLQTMHVQRLFFKDIEIFQKAKRIFFSR